uniref:Nucleolar protein 8 n=1 Tax=Anolis carolinensis TaxID=28377 RepID=G1KIK9_ANOCA
MTLTEFLNMQSPLVKRLYVGGLGHTVSKVELQERFGKFGNVTDTEILTRKDEQGISVLNKTKWKGGTLQIEMAKESFLHRLARERQEANENKEKPSENSMINVLESMKKSEIVDFNVKAVPGTEVPNHKDWVVSKFGRVLPILHLKSQHKKKIIKYDPSKYCHNLKKLDQDNCKTVPISQLTWHLEEGDENISKKRQGQFPVTNKPPKKKMKVQNRDSLNNVSLNSSCQFSSDASHTVPTKLVQNHTSNARKQCKEQTRSQKPTTGLTLHRNANSLFENDIDSEEEIRALIAREREVHNINTDVEPEDNMEIVGDNFELKYATHWSLQRTSDSKKAFTEALKTPENKSDYDSDDTDEIIAVNKIPNKKEKNGTPKTPKVVKQGKVKGPKGGISIHATVSESFGSKILISDKAKAEGKAVPGKMSDFKANPEKNSISSPSEDGGSSSHLDTSGSEGDDDYETMTQNCYRLDLTLEDLGRLAFEHSESAEEDAESNQSDNQCKTNIFQDNSISNIPKASTSTPKQCICPEDILSALLEEENSDEDNRKKKKGNVKVQPFRGIGSLSGELTKDKLDTHGSKAKKAASGPLDVETLKSVPKSLSKKLNGKSVSLKKTDSKQISLQVISGVSPDSSTSSADNSEAQSSDGTSASESEDLGSLKAASEERIKDDKIKGSCLTLDKNLNKSEDMFLDSTKGTSKLDETEKRLQDNAKRLTALQERKKEWEMQKKLIQGALTNLEIQSTNKKKHIVFDSDSENEADVQEDSNEGSSGNLGKEFTTKTSGKLFESSEDESVASDEDGDRFKIKPQFEGKAGEKLMHLQSRFGTDERFRMDARFLESDSEQEDESKNLKIDEEEGLAVEKKKNLEILKNLLCIDVEPPKPSKLTSNAKKFKDMNALRYDPTREDHTVFEKKPKTPEKESKAKKKKKREEAQKLPEVSKEIFYEVAVDLKEVFGSTKQDERTEEISWDKREDVEETPLADTETFNFTAGNNAPEGSSGFAFSFFGAEENRSPVNKEPYTIETIKPTKVAWQEDPRFQDSSSEDEESATVQNDDVKERPLTRLQSNVRFFFFSQDDDRLKEGPKLFCKSSDLDEDRDNWESRRQMLLEDCRKKHKDARRKVKVKQ